MDSERGVIERREFLKQAAVVTWTVPLVLTLFVDDANAQPGGSCIQAGGMCTATGLPCCDTAQNHCCCILSGQSVATCNRVGNGQGQCPQLTCISP